MMINDVSVAIDRLVLTDLDVRPEEAQRLGALIESELRALLESEGVPGSSRAIDVGVAQTVALELSTGLGEQQLARRVARRLLAALQETA